MCNPGSYNKIDCCAFQRSCCLPQFDIAVTASFRLAPRGVIEYSTRGGTSPIVMSADQTVSLHLPQLLCEDFLADSGQQPPQFGEAMRAQMQRPQQRRFHFPPIACSAVANPQSSGAVLLILLDSWPFLDPYRKVRTSQT